MRQGIALGIAVLTLPVAFYVVVLDQWAGLSRYPAFDLVVLALASFIALSAYLVSRRRVYWLIPASIALLLGFVALVDLSPVKPALRAVALIKPGMSEAEVRSVLEQHFPEHGRFKRPNMGPLRGNMPSFVLDPNDGRYNSAVVEISFRNGLSHTAGFLPD
jgi:hypothetical protein